MFNQSNRIKLLASNIFIKNIQNSFIFSICSSLRIDTETDKVILEVCPDFFYFLSGMSKLCVAKCDVLHRYGRERFARLITAEPIIKKIIEKV